MPAVPGRRRLRWRSPCTPTANLPPDRDRTGGTMHSKTMKQPVKDPTARSRFLAVVDWTLDPREVAAALHEHTRGRPARFGLLVPARLHGLQWIGDPTASRPCAERQLRELGRLLRERDLDVVAAQVGDPERVPAIDQALSDWGADEIVLVDRRKRGRGYWPFGLARRIRRASRLPLRSIPIRSAPEAGAGLRWVGTSPRCASPQAA